MSIQSFETCDQPDCPGHVGKFSSCEAEALYHYSLDGLDDDATGSMEYEGYMSMFTFPNSGETYMQQSGSRVAIGAGVHLVLTLPNGMVIHTHYSDSDEGERAFEEFHSRYIEWADGPVVHTHYSDLDEGERAFEEFHSRHTEWAD